MKRDEGEIVVQGPKGSLARLLRKCKNTKKPSYEVEIIERKGHHHDGDVVIWKRTAFSLITTI